MTRSKIDLRITPFQLRFEAAAEAGPLIGSAHSPGDETFEPFAPHLRWETGQALLLYNDDSLPPNAQVAWRTSGSREGASEDCMPIATRRLSRIDSDGDQIKAGKKEKEAQTTWNAVVAACGSASQFQLPRLQ